MQEKCSIDGCGRTKAKRGWCNTHYQRWRRHGDPDIVLQIRGSECAVESCSDHAVGQGYCNRHYQRLMKHGDPEYVAPKPKCQIAGCEKPHVGKGLCGMHLRREQRYGSPHLVKLKKNMTPAESVAQNSEWRGDCLVWTGYINTRGYGHVSINGKRRYAHRVSWESVNGPIPEGMYIDHKCWNTACVNPKHLRLATIAENSQYRNGADSTSTTGIRNVHRAGSRFRVVVETEGQAHLLLPSK